jgi:hypothetical protein
MTLFSWKMPRPFAMSATNTAAPHGCAAKKNIETHVIRALVCGSFNAAVRPADHFSFVLMTLSGNQTTNITKKNSEFEFSVCCIRRPARLVGAQ